DRRGAGPVPADSERQRAAVQARRSDAAQRAGRAAPAVSFTGRNAHGQLELALPPYARVIEGLHTPYLVQLIVDGAQLDAGLERTRDVTEFGSPVRNVATHRDAQVPDRMIVRLELIAPCVTSLRRTGEGVRLQLDEEAVW
ncbi:MAG TPA: hypothetical protein VGD80_08940, partial [Kofleriaceae bacterium]